MCESASWAWRMRTHIYAYVTLTHRFVCDCVSMWSPMTFCAVNNSLGIYSYFWKPPISTAIRNSACASKGESGWIHSKCAAHTYICRKAFVATVRFWYLLSASYLFIHCVFVETCYRCYFGPLGNSNNLCTVQITKLKRHDFLTSHSREERQMTSPIEYNRQAFILCRYHNRRPI